MVPNVVTVSGLARFYLKSAHPEFELYISPVQINPANQVLPITDPPEYGKELVDAVGYFYTQNMPEDTKALEHGVFDNEHVHEAVDDRVRRASRVFPATSSRGSTRGCSTSTSARSTSPRT